MGPINVCCVAANNAAYAQCVLQGVVAALAALAAAAPAAPHINRNSNEEQSPTRAHALINY